MISGFPSPGEPLFTDLYKITLNIWKHGNNFEKSHFYKSQNLENNKMELGTDLEHTGARKWWRFIKKTSTILDMRSRFIKKHGMEIW